MTEETFAEKGQDGAPWNQGCSQREGVETNINTEIQLRAAHSEDSSTSPHGVYQ